LVRDHVQAIGQSCNNFLLQLEKGQSASHMNAELVVDKLRIDAHRFCSRVHQAFERRSTLPISLGSTVLPL
jgi:hypothetical protein